MQAGVPMSSLEERSIASLRAKLLKCNVRFMNDTWDKTVTHVKGGKEHVVFETSIRRDVVAYVILSAVSMIKGSVFGGFVRSHFSGKPWNDIDILIPDKMSPDEAWTMMMRHIAFCLPLSMKQMRVRTNSKAYSVGYELRITGLTTDDISIRVDLVKQKSIDQGRHSHFFRPVTVGSCLCLRDGEVHFRSKMDASTGYWKISDVVEMLTQGEDIKLCVKTSSEQYPVFYWTRIERMRRYGWTLGPALTHSEPKRPDDAVIDAALTNLYGEDAP